MDRPEIDRVRKLVKDAQGARSAALAHLQLELADIDAREQRALATLKHRSDEERKAIRQQIAELEDPGPCS